MGGIGISVDRGGVVLALILLGVLLPTVWIFSYRSLAGLGNIRRFIALGLRTLVILLIVGALVEVKLERISNKMTVIFVLDQSESIPIETRQAMLDYVYHEVSRHRDVGREDRAGVIIFGGDAKIEVPPFDDDIMISRVESVVDLRTDATSLETALKLAKASFPEDTAKRVVLVTDGNENLGDGAALARSLSDDGIGIDVAPIRLERRSEVSVEKIAMPSDIRRGQTFETHVVINNDAIPSEDNPEGLVSGKLRLTRSTQQNEQLVAEQQVTLTPGKNIIGFKHEIDRSAMYTYKASFVPDVNDYDFRRQNNEATAFTHVRGRGRVLLIEDWQHPGEFDFMIDRLRTKNIEVDVMPSNDLFTSPAQLLEFDSIVLANVPRSSGDSADEASSFSDDQIQMLVRNTEELGCGIVMIGGPSSFGAGGWSNTELEKAMPVDFQIRNKRVQAVGALVLIMHASEMPDGNYWQKRIGAEAVKMLGPMDYCGLVQWNNFSGGEGWAWMLPNGIDQVVDNRPAMLRRISRMTPGDMQDFDPSMRLALQGFSKVQASVKHMIIISDGDPTPPSAGLLQQYVAQGIKITTVAVGTHGTVGHTTLENVATATSGEYYVVTNPKTLPKIYQREARRVSRPLIFEPAEGVTPIGRDANPYTGVMQGIEVGSLPTLKGYVMTTIKDNALVEQTLIADKPSDNGENSTLLATWRYGLGRTTVFTSDAGRRWATGWTESDVYDKFFSQLVRHSMRPISEKANFMLASDVKDGRVRIVVTALNENDEFLNFLDFRARGIGPDLKGFDIPVRQVSPGRYVGEFAADASGSYLFSLLPGDGYERLSAGVNIPYSSEFNDRETNRPLLENLVAYVPAGGAAGVMIDGDLAANEIDRMLATNTFRHDLAKAVSFRDLWLALAFLCAWLFFCDVLVRRVSFSWEWLKPLWQWVQVNIFRMMPEPQAETQMARLQSRKAAVSRELDQRRSAMRFDPVSDERVGGANSSPADVIQEASGSTSRPSASTPPRSAGLTPQSEESESYTSRLLAAKKRASQNRPDE